MLNLFKRKNKITKLFSDLPPGDRIQRLFLQYIDPFLSQKGFSFVKSMNSFKRKTGHLTHEIHISKNSWNRAHEVCAFWLVFSVSGDNYDKWHKQIYGVPPLNDCVTSFYHNHLKQWKNQFESDHYDLSKQDNIKVFTEIKENLQNIALPLLDQFSDYEKSADTLINNKEYWWAAKIYDYYLMAGKPDKANQALQLGKAYYDKQADPQKEFFDALKLRLNRK